MVKQRTDRLNSLLKEVISEAIRQEVKDPNLAALWTITRVDITKDLHFAKVYVSVIGDDQTRKATLHSLQHAAGFIAVKASERVTMRYFPALTFKLDDSVDKHMRIEELLQEIAEEKGSRLQGSADALPE